VRKLSSSGAYKMSRDEANALKNGQGAAGFFREVDRFPSPEHQPIKSRRKVDLYMRNQVEYDRRRRTG
jgi:hypothetical protein